MPSPYLPGPFLELDPESLAASGELNVDQLAALWNVFTKVGDSLHKGRRLENFAWRAWHREAHLLPPDSSWSDFADSTPLETPALSRAGSISHSFSRKPSILTAQWPTSGRIEEDENAPSDPEDGDEWSSDSGASSPEEVMQQQAGPSRRTVTSPPRAAPPAQQQLDDGSYRKRSISSSSAFGSRARVRFSNLKKSNRRRPLSFQAALRSLTSTNESDDLANLAREHRRQGLPEGHERRSLQGPPGAVDVASRPSEEEEEEEIAASHSSAPAAAEGSGSIGMSASASTKAMPPPPVPVEKAAAAAAATTASRDSSSSRRANFFLSSSVSKSLEDDDEPSQQPAPAAAAAPPPQPTSQQVAPAAPPPLKPNKSKTDLSHGHRKSGSGGSSKGKQSGHGRGSSGRLSALHGLTMTKTQPQPHAHAHAGPSKKASSKAPSRPVKFALGGGDDDDDDEFTDEEDEPQPPAKHQQQQAPAPAPAPAAAEPAAADESAPWEDDDDGWSSDTSAEAEEERRKAAAAAERRRKLDEERQQNMFKKIPVRSQSAADVRYLADHGRSSSDVGPRGGAGREVAQEQEVEEPLPQQVPVRGLLSSLFHPEQEPHSPPGQLHGRPHASAADLRARPAHEQQQPQQQRPAQPSRPPRTQRPSSKSGDQHRPPSLIAGTPSNDNGGPLRPSKSAAALPVLNVAAPDGGAGAPDVFESGSLIQQTSFEERTNTGGGAARSKSRERPPQATGSTSREAPAVAEHRAAAPVPAPIAPQTPRTTRRNMLRDELSESLRQNLLWERQSRNRMLGIGATAAREQSAPAPMQQQQQQQQQAPPPKPHRRETVLGGNTLRPLTQAQGSTSGQGQQQHQQQQQRPRPHSSGSSAVGDHSRSTSSLPRMNSNAAPTDLTPGAQQLSSAETSDEEDGNGRIGGADDHHHHAYPHGNSGSMSSSGGATVGGSAGNTAGGQHGHGHGGQKKKVMWPGGFPNYHQHGW